MNVNLYVLNASGAFTGEKQKIRSRFDEAVVRIAQLMPIRNVDVVILHSEQVIPQTGIGGFASNDDAILIHLDPSHENYENAIEEELERTLAHEFHHCMRRRNLEYGKTLAEALVFEGLADHFDIELTGKSIQPWCAAISGEQLRVLKLKAIEYLWEDINFNTWFFGSNENDIPQWSGYTLAFTFMKEYLERNKNVKPSQLYMKPAKEIFKELLT